jgi:hypothetical protein
MSKLAVDFGGDVVGAAPLDPRILRRFAPQGATRLIAFFRKN